MATDTDSDSPQLICLTGIDGAGKSTASRNLVRELNARGIEATYVYGKHRAILLAPFLRVAQAVFLKSDTETDYRKAQTEKRTLSTQYPLLIKIYIGILLVDYYLQLLIKLLPPLLRGQTVVCDRYVFDTVATDILNVAPYSSHEAIKLVTWLLTVVPTPDRTIMVDVPPAVSMDRKDDIPDIQFVRDRRAYFTAFSAHFQMQDVDGTLPPETLLQAVLDACDIPSAASVDTT